MATKYSFNTDKITEQQCSLAVAFLKSQIKGKGDVILYSLERMLEAVTNIGIDLPETKSDLVSIVNLINHFNISTNSSQSLMAINSLDDDKSDSKEVKHNHKKNKKKNKKGKR